MAHRIAQIFVLLAAIVFVTFSKGISYDEVSVKRGDDVSVTSLETLVEQQSALIVQLQSKLTAVENRVNVLENRFPNPAESCPDSWTKFQDSCYIVSDDALSWSEAAEVCEIFGANLAEVETSAENNFVKQLAQSHGYKGIWLGGTDILLEGQWMWYKSKQLFSASGEFTDWQPAQPDNGAGHQDCLVLFHEFDYKWDDNICDLSYQFLCEMRL